MKKDPKIYILHILECIEAIEKYLKEKTREEFLSNTLIQDAVLRRITIIGEATKNIPKDVRDKYKDIPWRRMAGMRDILIHDYVGVDLELSWGHC